MNFPKLKNPILCRFLPYLTVISIGLLPILIAILIPMSDFARILIIFAALIGLLAYIARNFVVLMGMDIGLALLSCYRTAKKQYRLSRDKAAILRSVSRFGETCQPAPIMPQPSMLRYKFGNPLTIYSCGIERVLAVYETDYLDAETYRSIFSSAKTNSKALTGRKHALFLDREQKKASLHRVTVALILAGDVDPELALGLYELVCKQCGNEEVNCILPCVVDLSRKTCVFNSLRQPYYGYEYAVKNRGIRMIKNLVFGGSIPYKNNNADLTLPKSIDPEQSLWAFWKSLHHQFIGADRKIRRQFEQMQPQQIRLEEDALCCKWDHRGILQNAKLDAEKKIVQIEEITDWYHPEMQPIGKQIRKALADHVASHFEKLGYTAIFVPSDKLI